MPTFFKIWFGIGFFMWFIIRTSADMRMDGLIQRGPGVDALIEEIALCLIITAAGPFTLLAVFQ